MLLPHGGCSLSGNLVLRRELEVESRNSLAQPSVVLVAFPAEVGVKFLAHLKGLGARGSVGCVGMSSTRAQTKPSKGEPAGSLTPLTFAWHKASDTSEGRSHIVVKP